MKMKFFTRHTLFELIENLVPKMATIVEAGAFDGRDTQRLAHWRPYGHIYAFEPVPQIFRSLQANTAVLANVTCYSYALSSTTATQKFYLSEHPKHPGRPFQAGSICVPKERLNASPVTYPRTIQVHTITLDDWATASAINAIDLLWLDVQGHALDILKASPHILKTISVLHVEVEFIEAYEGQPTYQEVVSWLKQQGFEVIGKDFRSTHDWFFGNLLFKRRSQV